MRPTGIHEELKAARLTGTPLVIAGDKGTGKSSVVEDYANGEGMDLFLSHPVTWDATDVKGLPAMNEARTEGLWLPYGDLLAAMSATKPAVWDFEDLGQAPMAVQASLMQIFLARRIGDHKIPDCVQLVATTNRVKDRAGVGMPLAPLKDRARILSMDVSIEDWSNWAARNKVQPSVIGYLNFRPEHLHSCVAVNDWQQDGSTPRGWERVSRRMDIGVAPDRELEVMAGDIGPAIAGEFVSYMRVYRELPDLSEVERKPDKVKVPKDLSAKYAVACALAHHATDDNVDMFEIYLARLRDGSGAIQREFRLLFWRQLYARDKRFVSHKAFVRFASDFKDITLGA